ncbi:tribbles homolog 3 isoform X2 [Hemicordylus capensis]|uniref:tribbles homolog 3 isoform X2 n=1 Tax=Hemicordylus capensis TaxID=884348 RepID=UPI0023032D78|nr:tribbles homolog 3 isoform X2 [Hemicordylus capensis]
MDGAEPGSGERLVQSAPAAASAWPGEARRSRGEAREGPPLPPLGLHHPPTARAGGASAERRDKGCSRCGARVSPPPQRDGFGLRLRRPPRVAPPGRSSPRPPPPPAWPRDPGSTLSCRIRPSGQQPRKPRVGSREGERRRRALCTAETDASLAGWLQRTTSPEMSLLTQECPMVAIPRKKSLDLDDASETNSPQPKRLRLSGPLPGPTPCLQPLPHFPPPTEQDSGVSQIGSYILLEATEGGRCYRAVHRHTEAEYTCKVYPAKSYPEVMTPYSTLPSHPNVACVAEVIVGDQNVYIFFQPGRGDMHNYVRQRKRLPEREAAALFQQMAEAVAHCHQHGIVLRDLKLRKFVFADRERSRLLLENLEDSWVLTGPDDSLEDKHGCPAYVGPEILSSKSSYSGKAADIWSLGVVLYTLLVGCYPFQDTKPALLFGKIRRGRFAVPEDLSPKARCLIRCLLRKDPSERLTASGVLLHPWLATASVPEGSGSSPAGEQQRLEQVVPEAVNLRGEEEEGLYG